MNRRKNILTGIKGFDDILGGGIREGDSILIQGAPGTGKTTAGMQFIVQGVKEYGEPGVIVVFEYEPRKLLDDAEGFGWDLEKLEKENKLKVIYTSASVILDEIHSKDNLIAQTVKEIGAKRIFIDSLTPLRHHAEVISNRPFRHSLDLLTEFLSDLDLTSILSQEAPEGLRSQEVTIGSEQYLVDGVVELRHELHHRNIHRYAEIIKLRGRDPVLGQHSFLIKSGAGIEMYRRAQSQPKYVEDNSTFSSERLSSGIEGLDKILDGGLYKGSITMISGISGTGKSLACMQFLAEGAKQGENTLYVSLEESPKQLINEGKNIGIPEDLFETEKIRIMYHPPVELELDIHFHKMFAAVEKYQIKRVVVDSMTAYSSSNTEETKEFFYALTSILKSKGATVFLSYEASELFGVSEISHRPKTSSIVDNIILLNYIEISTQLRRGITVPKARGTNNNRDTHEFVIDKDGIHVLPNGEGNRRVEQLPFNSYRSLIGKAPTRRSVSQKKPDSENEYEYRTERDEEPRD